MALKTRSGKTEQKARGQELTERRSMEWIKPLEEMERLYERLFPYGGLRSFQWDWPSWEKVRPIFSHKMPAVDVISREGEVLIRAEVPGVNRKDISVSLTDSTMTIRGHTEHEEEKKKEDYYFHEMRYGEFLRTVSLPAGVNPDKAKATIKDGILEVTLPMRERGKRHSVELEVE